MTRLAALLMVLGGSAGVGTGGLVGPGGGGSSAVTSPLSVGVVNADFVDAGVIRTTSLSMAAADSAIAWPVGLFSCNSTFCYTNNDFGPLGDNTTSLGVGGHRWSALRVVTASVDAKLSFVNMAFSATTPVISSGFGAGASIPASNGSVAFTVNVGTGGAASSGVISFGSPTAAQGWRCSCDDIAGAVGLTETRQSGSSTTTCSLVNVNTATGVAAAWVASEVLSCNATAY